MDISHKSDAHCAHTMGFNLINWNSIISGVIFAVALSGIIYLLGSAIGVTVLDPYQLNSINGLGYGTMAWILLTWCISLFGGGLLSGVLTHYREKSCSVLHGIIIWGICIILTFVVGTIGITGFFATGSQLLKTTPSEIVLNSSNQENSSLSDLSIRGVNVLALESDLKQQLKQVSSTSSNGEVIINSNKAQQAINQLNTDQVMLVANYLLAGNPDAAKNILALNTSLNEDEQNLIVNNLSDKIKQYQQNIQDYHNKIQNYTAAVLWTGVMSSFLGLLFAIFGGWMGEKSADHMIENKTH